MKLTETIARNAAASRRRRRRALLRTGGALAGIGLAALFPMQAFVAVSFPLLLPTFALQMADPPNRLQVALSMGAVLFVLLAIYGLAIFLAARKSVVLYLRRFRLTTAAQALSDAIESGVGRHHRILTLDDASFVPLEVPPLERWISRYGSLVSIAGASVVFLGVLWLAVHLFQRFGLSLSGLGVAGELILGGFLAFVVPFVGPALEYWLLFLVPAFLIHRWRVRKRSRIQVATEEDRSRCLEYGRTLSGRLRAPAFLASQATVVKVTDALWQEAVAGIAQIADAILIDVSAPSVHVLWEIETATRHFGDRIVYLGQRTLLEPWKDAPAAQDDPPGSARIRALLAETTVLAYEPTHRAAKRKFRQSLRNALENLSLPTPARQDVAASWRGVRSSGRTLLPPLWRSLLLYVGLGWICLALNFALWGVVWKRILAGLGYHP